MKLSLLRPADGILSAVCASVALILFVFFRTGGESGTQVVVETANGTTAVYALNKPTTVTIDGQNGLSVTLEIADGSVRVINSQCPDHVCEHSGRLSRGGQSAVCVPAGITVRVVGGSDAVDGVTA